MIRFALVAALTMLLLTAFGGVREQPKAWAVTVFDDRVMSGDAPLPIPSLQELTLDADTDSEALAAIVTYYESQRNAIYGWLNEANDERARALYGMYLVHLTAPYGVVETPPNTLLEFIATPTSHCGIQPIYQAMLYTALGLRWRIVSVDNGWHGYTEAVISGRYETFDATTNVWLNRSAEELIAGGQRDYRLLYTPILDRYSGAAWKAHIADGWDVLSLRDGLPFWGLRVFPSMWIVTASSD